MKNFLSNLGFKMMQFMQGRNGMDTLAQYALGAGLVLTVIDFFVNSFFISFAGLAFLVYSMFRCYSKNIASRALENAKFQSWVRGPQASIAKLRNRFANRSTTKYFKCEQCGQALSVPKGKGTLRVTCPKCQHKTTIKS